MLLHEKIKDYRLLLASGSPRRRQLLKESGFDFECVEKFECIETYPAALPVSKVAEYLSKLKSNTCPRKLTDKDILLTADTVVIVDNTILGKPHDETDACRMLKLLSGRSHKVVTGVTLRTTSRIHSFSVESMVRFREIDKDEIEYYVRNFRPLDKAGAYGIQEWIGYVAIEGIEGSFYNVMGLPIQRLYVELSQFIAE